MQQSNNFQTTRYLYLKEIIEKLDQQIQEINSDTKKKKKPQGEKQQQKLRCIASILDKVNKLSQELQQSALFIVEEKKWCKLKSLLNAFLNNSDNPEYENEITQIILQIQQDKNKPNIEPFDIKAANQSAQLVDQTSLSYKLKMMEISYNDRPQGNDYYQPPTFKEKLNLNSLLPKYKMLPHSIFTQLGSDTLFYIFYYHKEPTEQNMAARELIKKEWIFNSKHGLWMKKDKHFVYKEDENERVIKGPFLYFDYESRWQQKKKPEFQFKKKHISQFEIFQ